MINNLWRWLLRPVQLNFFGGGKGGGSSQQDTSMSRSGNTNVRAQHTPYGNTHAWGHNGLGRLTQDFRDHDIGKEVGDQSFNTCGVGNLCSYLDNSQASILNPQYETNTNAAFDNRLARANAVARTGEANVLAPIARGDSFRTADAMQQQLNSRQIEVEQQRELDFRKLLDGSNAMAAQRVAGAGQATNAKAGTLMPAEAMSKFLAPFQTDTAESIAGKGAQTASGQSWGVQGGASCCFIFLEYYNGELPKHVRECRDEFAPENTDRRKGYIWMSKWLVPAMKRSRLVRSLVNNTMVQPLTKWGGWYKGVHDHGYEYQSVKNFWFKTWEGIGKWL